MDDKIIIPYGLTMEQEYFPGFGSRELRQFFIGGAASAVLGALLLIFSGQLLALIVCIMTGASGSIMAVSKDPYTRISVVTQIGNMIKFRRTTNRRGNRADDIHTAVRLLFRYIPAGRTAA